MPTPQAESAMAVASISTSTANTPTDIEAQKQQQVASTTTNSTPGRAGKRLGIACFGLLLIGFIFNFIQPVGYLRMQYRCYYYHFHHHLWMLLWI